MASATADNGGMWQFEFAWQQPLVDHAQFTQVLIPLYGSHF
jgi:hypothetical protein